MCVCAQVVLALGRMRCRPTEAWAEWLAQELQGRVTLATPPLHVVQLVHGVAACMPDSTPLEDWVLSVTGETLLPHIQVLAGREDWVPVTGETQLLGRAGRQGCFAQPGETEVPPRISHPGRAQCACLHVHTSQTSACRRDDSFWVIPPLDLHAQLPQQFQAHPAAQLVVRRDLPIHAQALGPTELVSVVWACARMGRNLDDGRSPSTPVAEAARSGHLYRSRSSAGASHITSLSGRSSSRPQEQAPGRAVEEEEEEEGEEEEEVEGKGFEFGALGGGGRAALEATCVREGRAWPGQAGGVGAAARHGSPGSSSTGSWLGRGRQQQLAGEGDDGAWEYEGASEMGAARGPEGVMLWHSGHRLRLSRPTAAALTRALDACLDSLDAQQFSMLLISLPRLGMWLPEVRGLCAAGAVAGGMAGGVR